MPEREGAMGAGDVGGWLGSGFGLVWLGVLWVVWRAG